MRVQVNPGLVRWARKRAGFEIAALTPRFPHLQEWERGEAHPTLCQLESFAGAVHVPVGYLFLAAPPVEEIPIPDFRTMRNAGVSQATPDLLETVYICQQRQEWYRDFARSVGEKPLPFVGSEKPENDVVAAATRIRSALGLDLEERRGLPTAADALRRFIENADLLGVLVMVSGVVGSNNRRKLDPQEFRGFALTDSLAPLVFINGADAKAAQMFTLAHELAHVWLGRSALSDVGPTSAPVDRVEDWCNRVAAELLVPLAALGDVYRSSTGLREEVARLSKHFKVSSLVMLRRIHDIGGLTREQLTEAYRAELSRLSASVKGSGGDFYLTQAARVGKRFARALIVDTLEGQTLHRDAFRLLGFSKLETFRALGRRLGVA